jgi:hypothetical protein
MNLWKGIYVDFELLLILISGAAVLVALLMLYAMGGGKKEKKEELLEVAVTPEVRGRWRNPWPRYSTPLRSPSRRKNK